MEEEKMDPSLPEKESYGCNFIKLNKKFSEELIAYYSLIRHVQQFFFFYCCVYICCSGNVFTEPLPSNTYTQTDGKDL
jgi:hypothetical protein